MFSHLNTIKKRRRGGNFCIEKRKNMCGDKRTDGSSKTNGTVTAVTVFILSQSWEQMRIRSVFSLPQAKVPDSCEYDEIYQLDITNYDLLS